MILKSMRVPKCKSELASHTENHGLGNKSNDAFISKDKGNEKKCILYEIIYWLRLHIIIVNAFNFLSCDCILEF